MIAAITQPLTLNDMTFEAAKALHAKAVQDGRPATFTAADLVVTCWRCWPNPWRLGKTEYPCSHKMAGVLVSRNVLLKDGLLVAAGGGVFRLGERGLIELKLHPPRMDMIETELLGPKDRINGTPRRAGGFIGRAMDSDAYAKVQANRKGDLNSRDARLFWDADVKQTNAEAAEAWEEKFRSHYDEDVADHRQVRAVHEILCGMFVKKGGRRD